MWEKIASITVNAIKNKNVFRRICVLGLIAVIGAAVWNGALVEIIKMLCK